MMPHSLLQGTMDVQIVKLCLQPDTSCGCPRICEDGSIRKDTPELIPIDCSCDNKSLLPFTVPEGIALAPLGVFKVLRCGCATGQLYANDRCMSGTVQMPRAVSCGCHGMEECCNILTNNAELPKKTWTVTMMTSTYVMAQMF